jgi:glycosyltransferase involved in cell wall biosynthesis
MVERSVSNGSAGLAGGMFLTWEQHRRTRGLAAHFGLSLEEVGVQGSRLRRYWRQIARTYGKLRSGHAPLIFVQNPSIVLTVFVLCWRAVTRRKCVIVMDAHNEAVVPEIFPWQVVRLVASWAIRKSDFTMVTNRSLPNVVAAPVRVLGTAPVVRLLVIATYASDEPIAAILDAARQLVGSAEFQFTGNFRKLDPATVASVAPNVTFLGFVTDEEYWERMRAADAVVDLTLLDDCLVCGAYEAVAVGRPLVLSDTRALRDYFRQGAVYCGAEPAAIVSAVRQLQADYPRLSEEVARLRPLLNAEWSGQAAAVVAELAGGRGTT